MKVECRFTGGPYEGNYYHVDDSENRYEIISQSATRYVVHVYGRENNVFRYLESECMYYEW